jgi:fatty-acyl-CoA synthase
MTIGQAFDNTVAQYPDGEALVVRHQQLRYTWRQLADAVDLHARALLALGLQAGDRLGIWAPNCAQWCISQFASAKIGVILVNINPAYRSSELEYVLKQSGCQWLVCAGAFKTSITTPCCKAWCRNWRSNPSATAQRAPAGVARRDQP